MIYYKVIGGAKNQMKKLHLGLPSDAMLRSLREL
jgi:hypothetical protein